jgi:hypothetical protein
MLSSLNEDYLSTGVAVRKSTSISPTAVSKMILSEEHTSQVLVRCVDVSRLCDVLIKKWMVWGLTHEETTRWTKWGLAGVHRCDIPPPFPLLVSLL